MEFKASDTIAAALSRRFQGGADSGALADELVVMWTQVESALVPVIGRRGLAVLFRRVLSVTSNAVPWLKAVKQASPTDMDLAGLRACCVEQSPASVNDGGRALFTTFYALLGSLVGASLTAQLLTTVRGTLSDDVQQDTRS